MAELAEQDDFVVGHKAVLEVPALQKMLAETDVHGIIVYRDPRDAALSYWHRVGGGVEEYLERWKTIMRFVLDGPAYERFFAIRFEDLLNDRKRALEPLATKLGLTLQEAGNKLSFRGGSAARSFGWPGNSPYQDVSRPFDTAPLERWRRMPGSPVVRYAEWLCSAEMERLGYRRGSSLSARERAAHRLRRTCHKMERGLEGSAKWMTESVLRRVSVPLTHLD